MSDSFKESDSSCHEIRTKYLFTRADRDILRSYEGIVDGLAALIGAHCEIVLHSLDDLERSAIRIANGEHTGRQIGSPVTSLALQKLHEIDTQHSHLSRVYFTRAKSGALMKSMTLGIRNSTDHIIGLLCINMNLDVPFSQIMATFVPPEVQTDQNVNFASSVDELVTQILEHTIEEVGNDRNVANNAKNRQVVLNLFEKGIFDIKDAINQVADRLNISKHTVYLYIRQFRQDDPSGEGI